MLDVWPEFPIAIRATFHMPWSPHLALSSNLADVIAALERHHDRVCDIHLVGSPLPILKIFRAMERPFPSLVNLMIASDERYGSIIPNRFLGGSAPRLESLDFYDIQCHAIEELLLSTPNLVSLSLAGIPDSKLSPEAMVNVLSVLTRLKSIRLIFHHDGRSQQAGAHPSPFSRVVLPSLTNMYFYGHKEYLEDIVSRIDTPLLADIFIDLSASVVVTPPLRDFIDRTEASGAYSKIDIRPSGLCAKVEFIRPDGEGV
jgi:hypothetical protein